ncbi:nuclear transport factor 2 family protein [Azospirillum agricola]|uniref:nuclear transport factor 2 family protein n=1 Tax=Azospirillum agricola TaxID=1720247 RepID=UPI000A0F22C2|nr:nuclear transport factor 2 family protein [Azospirillum agricola]SMH37508.1 steroid delta-isomerase [Azospirillum lipoferum]
MSTSASEMAAALLHGTRAGDPARMRAVFEAYLGSWRAGDPEARAALFVSDAVVEDPVGGPVLRGMTAVRRFWADAEGAGYAFDPRLELFIPCGSEALARFVMRMTKDGQPPVAMTIHEVLGFDGQHRLTSLRAFWTQESIAQLDEVRMPDDYSLGYM